MKINKSRRKKSNKYHKHTKDRRLKYQKREASLLFRKEAQWWARWKPSRLSSAPRLLEAHWNCRQLKQLKQCNNQQNLQIWAKKKTKCLPKPLMNSPASTTSTVKCSIRSCMSWYTDEKVTTCLQKWLTAIRTPWQYQGLPSTRASSLRDRTSVKQSMVQPIGCKRITIRKSKIKAGSISIQRPCTTTINSKNWSPKLQ